MQPGFVFGKWQLRAAQRGPVGLNAACPPLPLPCPPRLGPESLGEAACAPRAFRDHNRHRAEWQLPFPGGSRGPGAEGRPWMCVWTCLSTFPRGKRYFHPILQAMQQAPTGPRTCSHSWWVRVWIHVAYSLLPPCLPGLPRPPECGQWPIYHHVPAFPKKALPSSIPRAGLSHKGVIGPRSPPPLPVHHFFSPPLSPSLSSPSFGDPGGGGSRWPLRPGPPRALAVLVGRVNECCSRLLWSPLSVRHAGAAPRGQGSHKC